LECIWEDYITPGDTFTVEMLSRTEFDLEIDSNSFPAYVSDGSAVSRDEVLLGETLAEIKATHSEQSGRTRHFVNPAIRPFDIVRWKAADETISIAGGDTIDSFVAFRSAYQYVPAVMRPQYVAAYGFTPTGLPEVENLTAASANLGTQYSYAYYVTVEVDTDFYKSGATATAESYSRFVKISKQNDVATDKVTLDWDDVSPLLFTGINYKIYRYNPDANEFWYLGESANSTYDDLVPLPWVVTGGTPGSGDAEDQVAFTRGPAQAVDAFRGEGNYPGAITLAAQRLIMGATNNDPDATWASEIAEFSDFRKTEPSLDIVDGSSAFKVRAWAKSASIIQSYAPLNDVLILSDRAELALASGADGVLSAASVSLPIQSYNGSSRALQPLVVDNAVIYAQEKGRVIRDIRTGLNSSASLDYQGRELSVLVDHLLQEREITSWSWASSPDSFVFMTLDNGEAIMMAYSAEHDTIAFTPQDTDGDFKQTESLDEGDQNGVYVLVERGVGLAGNREILIERLRTRNEEHDVELAFHVDNGTRIYAPLIDETIQFQKPVGVWYLTLVGAGAAHDGTVVDLRGFVLSNTPNGRYELSHNSGDWYDLKDPDSGDLVSLDYDTRDDFANFTLRPPITGLTGLTHLAGSAVAIVVNGHYEVGVVSAGGAVTVSNAGSIFTVGRAFQSLVQTLPAGVSARAGYLGERFFGRRKSVQQLTLRLYRTRGIQVGGSEATLRTLDWMTDENYYEPIALFTGDKKTPLKGLFDTDGSVFVVQDEPFPFTITALFPDLKVGDT
jgi:hypothetical protein